jgi:hypothetical protein
VVCQALIIVLQAEERGAGITDAQLLAAALCLLPEQAGLQLSA